MLNECQYAKASKPNSLHTKRSLNKLSRGTKWTESLNYQPFTTTPFWAGTKKGIDVCASGEKRSVPDKLAQHFVELSCCLIQLIEDKRVTDITWMKIKWLIVNIIYKGHTTHEWNMFAKLLRLAASFWSNIFLSIPTQPNSLLVVVIIIAKLSILDCTVNCRKTSRAPCLSQQLNVPQLRSQCACVCSKNALKECQWA